MKQLQRYLPISFLFLLALLAWGFGLPSYLTLDHLMALREMMLFYVKQHFFFAALAYVVVYTTVIALSIPGAIVMTILGGHLFGLFWGAFFTVIGATLGATILFFAAKTAVGDFLKRKASHHLQEFQKNFKEDSISYLLFLRFVPLFPFWLVNLGAALMGVSLPVFFWTTLIGIIPGTVVYTQVGVGLGDLAKQSFSLSLGELMTPNIVFALLGLALLSLVPIFLKKYFRKKS